MMAREGQKRGHWPGEAFPAGLDPWALMYDVINTVSSISSPSTAALSKSGSPLYNSVCPRSHVSASDGAQFVPCVTSASQSSPSGPFNASQFPSLVHVRQVSTSRCNPLRPIDGSFPNFTVCLGYTTHSCTALKLGCRIENSRERCL